MNFIEKEITDSSINIAIEENINIYSVNEIKDQIATILTQKKDINLDLSKVDKIDSAGYQLLLIIKQEVEYENKEFSILNPSDEVKRIYTLYGESI